jgi:hypothetical protein
MYVIRSHIAIDYHDVARFASLSDQLAQSRFHPSVQCLAPIFRNPHYLVFYVVFCMTAGSLLFGHNANSIASLAFLPESLPDKPKVEG